MTAILKKIREKRGGFEVPTVEEIGVYMKEKKSWPEKFVQFYAEKFWNNYEASGWKLSNGNSMKSWQAAFSAQWQTVRYKEDIDFLHECQKEKKPTIVKEMNQTQRLNALLKQYEKDYNSLDDKQLVKVYDYLKANKMIRLTPEEVSYIRQAYSDNVEKGKAASVKRLFMNMINYGSSF